MKKIFTFFLFSMGLTAAIAQPVLYSDSLHTGISFNLYNLTNVNTANLATAGAAVTWDISGATATLFGTADFMDMASTPYAAQYPAANFAMRFIPIGSSELYSLFTLTTSSLNEVANNVGTPNETSFIDPRETLVFPFIYNTSSTDVYQKTGQGQKVIVNNYESYGTLVTSFGTTNNIVRITTTDNGNTSLNFWGISPLVPMFQASSSGFTLWESTGLTGISTTVTNELFDMYPNPAINELHIVNKQLLSKIEIINSAGAIQITTTQSRIDISMLASGVYFVKAYTAGKVISQKFIKQ